jgi:hypothetical protein
MCEILGDIEMMRIYYYRIGWVSYRDWTWQVSRALEEVVMGGLDGNHS